MGLIEASTYLKEDTPKEMVERFNGIAEVVNSILENCTQDKVENFIMFIDSPAVFLLKTLVSDAYLAKYPDNDFFVKSGESDECGCDMCREKRGEAPCND